MSRKPFATLAALLLVVSPLSAHAACTGPAAAVGSFKWFSTAFKYCDGTNWQSFGSTAGGSSTQVQYNSSGSLSGDSGFTYGGSGVVTINGAGSASAMALSATTTGTSSNKAVYGHASGASGLNFGGYFEATSGYGVRGIGSSIGGSFIATDTTGAAVHGRATSTTGANYGGFFTSDSSGGISLYAAAGNAATKGLVVRGTGSQTGNLAEFQNSGGSVLVSISADGAITTSGAAATQISSTSSGSAAKAVYGRTTYYSSTTYGGYFQTDSTSGAGVYGYANNTVGSVYGGWFKSDSNSGIGVYIPIGHAAGRGLLIQGAASQSGNLAEFLSNSSATLAVVTAAGNVGIGTATPGGKLHVVSGATSFSVAPDVYTSASVGVRPANDGTVSFAMNYGANIWKFDASSGSFDIYQGASRRLTIDSSGNTGIATPSPVSKLDVLGGYSTPALNSSAGSIATFTSATTVQLQFGAISGGTYASWIQSKVDGQNAAYPIALQPAGGNVGIGMLSPPGKLTVGNTQSDGAQTAANSGINFTQASWTQAAIYPVGTAGFNGDLVFATDGDGTPNYNPTEKMRIMSNGNVGIGTAVPATFLDIKGANVSFLGQLRLQASDYAQMTFYDSANPTASGSNRKASIYWDVAGAGFYISSLGTLSLTSSNLMTIGGSGTVIPFGNVGIGTTSPDEKLTVAGVIRVSTGLPANPAGQTLCYGTQNGHTDTFGFCSSDARLKENIRPLKQDGLETILALRPVNFDWKATKLPMAGFIAQDVAKIIPEAILGQEKSKYYGLDTTAILSYAVKAIQELKADNDNLRREFEAYKAAHR